MESSTEDSDTPEIKIPEGVGYTERYKYRPEYEWVEKFFEPNPNPAYGDSIRWWYDHHKSIKLVDHENNIISYKSGYGYNSRTKEWIYHNREPGPGFKEISHVYGQETWVRIGDGELHRMVGYGTPLNPDKWKPKKMQKNYNLLDVMEKNQRYYFLDYLVLPSDDPDVLRAKQARKDGKGKMMRKYGANRHKKKMVVKNFYKGEHPITVQHKWLRVMAQVCKSWNKYVKDYRAIVQKKLMDEAWSNGWSRGIYGDVNFLEVEKKMTKNQSKHKRAVKKTKKRQNPDEWKKQVAINTAKRDITRRANLVSKWNRRIEWYKFQLERNPPAKTAQTYQTTLEYLRTIKPPKLLQNSYLKNVIRSFNKPLLNKPNKNEWQLVTNKRRKPKVVAPAPVEEKKPKKLIKVPTYEEKIAQIVEKLVRKNESRWARYLERLEWARNYDMTLPKSMRPLSEYSREDYVQQAQMIFKMKKIKRERKAEKMKSKLTKKKK